MVDSLAYTFRWSYIFPSLNQGCTMKRRDEKDCLKWSWEGSFEMIFGINHFWRIKLVIKKAGNPPKTQNLVCGNQTHQLGWQSATPCLCCMALRHATWRTRVRAPHTISICIKFAWRSATLVPLAWWDTTTDWHCRGNFPRHKWNTVPPLPCYWQNAVVERHATRIWRRGGPWQEMFWHSMGIRTKF